MPDQRVDTPEPAGASPGAPANIPAEVPAVTPLGFRCKKCGRVVAAEFAGESPVPHACPVCGAGVLFGTDPEELLAHPAAAPHVEASPGEHWRKDFLAGGRLHNVSLPGVPVYKLYVHENWEVLADADDGRLEELGLKREHVGRHVPPSATVAQGTARTVEAGAADGPVTTDRGSASPG